MISLPGIFAGLGAMFGWGVGDFMAAKASKQNGSLQTVFISSLLAFIVIGIAFFGLGLKLEVPLSIYLLLAGINLLFSIALFTFYRSLEIGPVSITSPISSAYAMITVLIAVFLIGEKLTPYQLLAIALIILGIIFVSIQFDKLSVRISNKKGIVYAFVSLVLWGICYAFLKIAVDAIGWLPSLFIGYAFSVIWYILIFGFRQNGFKKLWGTGVNKYIVLTTIFTLFGVVSFNFGLSRELTAIITPISSTYPAITVLLALAVFKEKVSKNQFVGVAMIIAGLVLLVAR